MGTARKLSKKALNYGTGYGIVKGAQSAWDTISGKDQADAYEEAAAQQSDATKYAADLSYKMFQENKDRLNPWVVAGSGSLNALSKEMAPGGGLYDTDFTAEDFNEYKDPGYDWRVKQGQNALAAQSSAMGNLGSGNLGTALVDYGQNAASQEYQNAYARYMNSQNTLYDRLYNLSSMGSNAASGVANMGTNTAANMGEFATQGANALAAGTVGAANARAAGFNNLLNQGVQSAALFAML